MPEHLGFRRLLVLLASFVFLWLSVNEKGGTNHTNGDCYHPNQVADDVCCDYFLHVILLLLRVA